MKLYFIPFACSLATRIAINEAELDADFIQVTPGGKLPDGRDFAGQIAVDRPREDCFEQHLSRQASGGEPVEQPLEPLVQP